MRDFGRMNDQKCEYWGKLIAEQEASGQTIRAFCKERGISDHSFYFWRKRLGTSEPVQFALLKTVTSAATLELILASGERTTWRRSRSKGNQSTPARTFSRWGACSTSRSRATRR